MLLTVPAVLIQKEHRRSKAIEEPMEEGTDQRGTESTEQMEDEGYSPNCSCSPESQSRQRQKKRKGRTYGGGLWRREQIHTMKKKRNKG